MTVYIYILTMAVTTYLIRVLPLLFFKKPIQSKFLRSFLHYVPIACLTAMTFPAILYTTENIISGVVGLIIAVILSMKNNSLIVVAATSCIAVFLIEQILCYL